MAKRQPGGEREYPGLDRLPTRPENLLEFRLGQLILLLNLAESAGPAHSLDVERIGYYDFFSANPFLVFGDDQDRMCKLTLAGFDSRSLSYQSSAQRFNNRRARLQHDLALLVSFGLVQPRAHSKCVSYELTSNGQQIASAFESLYARAYRKSGDLVVRYLSKLSITKIRKEAKVWLKAATFLVDIYDMEMAP